MQGQNAIIETQPAKEEEAPISAKFYCVFLLMIMAGVLGWIVENSAKLLTDGYMDNRFHVLPCIFPYGLAFLAMHVVLGDTNDIGVFGKKLFGKKSVTSKVVSNILYVVIACTFVFLGELAVGNAYEWATGAHLWDYSHKALHVTRYACLPTALELGIGAYLVMKFGYYPMLNLLMKKGNLKAIKAVDLTLGTLVVIDSICMILITLITKNPPIYWKIYI